MLAKLKVLRGTAFDLFGYSQERRTERKLIADYEALLDEIVEQLTPDNHHLAVGLAAIPEKIRGFGHVKARSLRRQGRRGGAAGAVPCQRRRCSRRRSRVAARAVVVQSCPQSLRLCARTRKKT